MCSICNIHRGKVLCIDVPQYKRRIIDSMSFLPMALSKLPPVFGLTELKKGFFPHFFNTRDNQKYVGPIPDVSYYDPDSMSEGRSKEFHAWYAIQKSENRVFDLQEELLTYCISDVNVLRRCCVLFREMFMHTSAVDANDRGVDPLQKTITIASACNLVFCRNFLAKDNAAMNYIGSRWPSRPGSTKKTSTT